MGLIERAANEIGDIRPAARAPRRGGPTDGGPAPERFDIDYRRLAAAGLYTPNERPDGIALELRAIKRRLMKRLSFYKLEREKLRAMRFESEQRNVVLVTSTRPAEGKTFVAINLALSLAIEDQIDTVLVDADAPRPKVFAHFGLAPRAGLTDRLRDTRLPTESLLVRANQAPLSLMSEGLKTRGSSELFALEEMKLLIGDLAKARQDRLVIIDAPPVLSTTEAVLLAKHVDEIIFVVEANATPESAVLTALDDITDSNQNVSMVLNKCIAQNSAKQYGAYYGYYRKDNIDDQDGGGDLSADA